MGRKPEDQPHAEPAPEETPEQTMFNRLVHTTQAHFWANGDTWVTHTYNPGDTHGVTEIQKPYRLKDAIDQTLRELDLAENPPEFHRIIATVLPNSIQDLSVIRAGGAFSDWNAFYLSTGKQVLQGHITTTFPHIAKDDTQRGLRALRFSVR